MTGVQAVAMVLVALGGGAVAMIGEPLRQTLALAVYGLSLTVLFFSLQAPDVALSEIVVSTVGLPVIVLAALRKIREHEREQDSDGDER